METLILQLAQLVLLLGIAPFISGTIKKTKARLQGRQGPPILQPYYDLFKYMHKDSVVARNSTWIFSAAPYVAFGSTLAAASLVPAVWNDALFSHTGDLFLIIYLFALSRFFVALAGIDTGSSFGAQGASRDLFVAALAEPVLFVTLLVTALPAKTTNLSAIVISQTEGGLHITPAYFMMLASFLILIVTETGRVPVDNPDTHLELTMIHEGAYLEYSGKPLALLLWSAEIKQIILFVLLSDLCFPWGISRLHSGPAWLEGAAFILLKLIFAGLIMACIEMSNAKMRLFKIPRMLSASFLLSLFALIAESLL